DRVILSEAVHLRRKRFPDVEFYLASCDKHFSGFRKPWDVIPKEIKKQFGISCCLPRDITPKFTKKKTSKK
ncbi:hypothetical protein KKA69_01760, partial [Patescibacteria group bacterium]|nr:hypothetical protein [Patescibacteria group bacterium]